MTYYRMDRIDRVGIVPQYGLTPVRSSTMHCGGDEDGGLCVHSSR